MPDTQPPEIPSSDVLASQGFRLLNALIDEAVTEAKQYDAMIQSACRRIAGLDPKNPEHTVEVHSRTYEERQAGAENTEVLDIKSQMANLVSMQANRSALLERIQDLQTAKLRLLNDYDFTRGNDSFQRAILAPESLPAGAKQ